MNDTAYTVVDDTSVIVLHNLTNDNPTVKFIDTKDKKQICYLDFVSNKLKNHGFEN